LSAANNEAIDKWFSCLDQVQPANGRLTDEVLAAAGGFPIYKPPGDAFDNRHDPVRRGELHEAMVAKSYATEMAQFRARMAQGGKTDGTAEAEADARLKAQYWSEISAWLKTLF
jgi:hypothetical protein